MTTFHNQNVCRKSSVYNQTGQSYFEQLSAYNHMSAHLRRVLLARSVVDSRNKKYKPEKRSTCRSSCRSKSLDKTVARRDIVDEIAYDTKHHPIDLLRMSLGDCDAECRRMKKRILEHTCARCDNDWYIQYHGSSSKISRRREINTSLDRSIRSRANNSISPVKSTQQKSCRSARPYRSTGGQCSRQPEIFRAGQKNCLRDESSTRPIRKSNRASDVVDETYSYDSSFESSSDTSDTAPDTKRFETSSPRTSRVDSTGIEQGQQLRKLSDIVEPTDDSKYAKFLYDITQEIMLNSLYTDQELHAIFRKHVEMNFEILDHNRMLSEIYQLKMALNVKEFSEEDEENDIERFVGLGRFATFSPLKPPTPPKTLDENKVAEKLRNQEGSWRFDESRRRSRDSQGTRNTVVLVDANPEILVTEHDVLVTLMEMKLDPRQVRTICKSLLNKSRETALSQTVQVDHEAMYSKLKEVCDKSWDSSRADRATSYPLRSANLMSRISALSTIRAETNKAVDSLDRTLAVMEESVKKKGCECRCRDKKTAFVPPVDARHEARLLKKPEESQTDREQAEVHVSQTQTATTSTALDRMNEGPSRSSELQKISEISQTEEDKSEVATQIEEARRTSSSDRDEGDHSEKIESGDKGRMKKKKRSSSIKKTTLKPDQSEECNTKRISKPAKELIDTIDKIDKSPKNVKGRKSTGPNKSTSPTIQKPPVAVPHSTRLGKQSETSHLSPKKSRKVSLTSDVETDISEKSGATLTDITTEKDSHGSKDEEKINEITDDEMASLPEENSLVEEPQIVEELSTIVESDNAEESQSQSLDKFKSIQSEITAEEQLGIADDSKEKQRSVAESRIIEESEFEQTVVAEISSQDSKLDENINEEKKILDDTKVDVDQIPDDKSSISEDLEKQPTLKSEDRLNVPGSNDISDSSAILSTELKRENESDDEDVMINASNADKKSDEAIHNKETRELGELSELPSSMSSTPNDISDDIISDDHSEIQSIDSKTCPTAKIVINEPTTRKKLRKLKKKKEPVCRPCFEMLIGKSRIWNDNRDVKLISRSPKKNERKRTTFDEPMTTVSDISLLKKEDMDSSVERSFENALEVGEIPAIVEDEEESNQLPWMRVKKELPEEPLARLEASTSRRDTIHRKTSLIRNLRIAVDNLKKRRTSETTEPRKSDIQPFPTETESSSDVTTLPESTENVPDTFNKDPSAKRIGRSNNEDTSRERK